MLELYEPAGAFEQLAEYVAAAGCDVDVFLAYGLSESAPPRRHPGPGGAVPAAAAGSAQPTQRLCGLHTKWVQRR